MEVHTAPTAYSSAVAGRDEGPRMRAPLRERVSWALYGFSNTLFSMNVMTLYFSAWLVYDLGASNTLYATGNAIACLIVVGAIPVLGALSDERRRRKPWVVGFTVAAALACASIGILGQLQLPHIGTDVVNPQAAPAGWHAGAGTVFWVLAVFVIANFTFQSAQPFYNAMLPELVPVEERGRISGLGAALGYTGSIVGVILVIPFFNGRLPLIGPINAGFLSLLRHLPFASAGGRVSTFVPTAILFVLFSVPFMLWCRDHFPVAGAKRLDWPRAFREVAHTLRDAKQHPGALRFIITSLIYQDAKGTIVTFMALYAINAVGFREGAETSVFLVLTIPSVFGSLLYGRLIDRIGPKQSLQTTLGIWIALLVLLIALPGKSAFWVIGFFIGLNYGGVVACERTVLLSLVPPAEGGRYFSLMLLSSEAAALIGPLIWAATVDFLSPRVSVAFAYRAAVFTVLVMFSIAFYTLRKVPNRQLAPV